MFEQTDEILNVDQYCDILNVGKSTGYKLLKCGKIKGFKIGAKWKIPTKSIERFVLANVNLSE